MASDIFNPSTWEEPEVGGSLGVQGQCGLHGKFRPARERDFASKERDRDRGGTEREDIRYKEELCICFILITMTIHRSKHLKSYKLYLVSVY